MKFFFISIICIATLCCNNTSVQPKKNQPKNLVNSSADALQPVNDDTISIVAVGDIMFGTNFPNTSKMPPEQGKNLLQPISNYLKNADVTFGNAEGVFLNEGGTPKGTGGQVYCFRQPTYMAQYFVDNGFDLLSVANNHVADFGDIGLKSTNDVLSKLPIAYGGIISKPIAEIKVRNTNIGMAAFAPHKGSVDMNNIANAIKIVQDLKKRNQIVIVSFHGGAEGVTRQRVPKKKEIFYGQDRGDVHDFAHKMIDAGADVLIGHGPHVVRAVELYKNKFIAYSLGNFCTYGMFSLGGASGNAPLLKLYVNQKGDFNKAEIISCKQYGEGGPVLDEVKKNAFNTIAYLTKLDFPNTPLVFNNGKIIKK
jgi:poly-gamma-glutamate capsule biosynthesis protein CapA/YwtB (metallophosphatase superfamily)